MFSVRRALYYFLSFCLYFFVVSFLNLFLYCLTFFLSLYCINFVSLSRPLSLYFFSFFVLFLSIFFTLSFCTRTRFFIWVGCGAELSAAVVSAVVAAAVVGQLAAAAAVAVVAEDAAQLWGASCHPCTRAPYGSASKKNKK